MATVRSVPALPNALWQTILDKFDACDQAKLRRVCRRFSELTSFSFVDLDKFGPMFGIVQRGCTDLSAILCCLTATIPTQRCRVLVSDNAWSADNGKSKCRDLIPRQLGATFPHLTTLIMRQFCFDINSLECLPNLEMLVVRTIDLPESGLSEASGRVFQTLRSFSLEEDTGLYCCEWRLLLAVPSQCVYKIKLAVFPTIDNVTEEDVLLLKRNAVGLRQLELWTTSKEYYGDESFDCAVLRHLDQLRSLKISLGLETTDFAFLAGLTCLTSLSVRGNQDLTAGSLRHLPNLRQLLYLNVSGTLAATDELLLVLRAAECQLRFLKANYQRCCEIFDGFSSDALVGYLEWCKWLKVLEVKDHTSLTDSIFWANGAYVHTLERLDISYTQCGQAGLDLFRQKRVSAASCKGVRGAPNIDVDVSFSYHHGTQDAAEDGFNVKNWADRSD